MHRFANPGRFMRFGAALLPWTTAGAILCLAIGLVWGFVFAPPDYQQGEAVRIIYIHVPAAWMAMFIYTCIALASASALIWRHPLGDLIARALLRLEPDSPSSRWSPARSGADPCGAPTGFGMPASPPCSSSSSSISAIWRS
ncbi:MAG TPA: cytochrome c biogenesis protein CcsA [Dongiaceae bacterium]